MELYVLGAQLFNMGVKGKMLLLSNYLEINKGPYTVIRKQGQKVDLNHVILFCSKVDFKFL